MNPSADQDLFIDYNISPYSPPADWVFEPCSSHYDHVCPAEALLSSCTDCYQGGMSVEPAPKVYLQNRLSRCRGKLQELEPVLTSKRKCGTLGPYRPSSGAAPHIIPNATLTTSWRPLQARIQSSW